MLDSRQSNYITYKMKQIMLTDYNQCVYGRIVNRNQKNRWLIDLIEAHVSIQQTFQSFHALWNCKYDDMNHTY